MFKQTILTVAACSLAALLVGCGGDDKGGGNGGGGGGGAARTGGTKEIDPAKTGSVVVTVKHSGEAPAVDYFNTSGNADCNRVTGGQVQKEILIVNENGTIANAFVYAEKGFEEYKVPAAPSEAVVLDQENCRYDPHVVAVRTGQTLTITNSDDFAHNVHGLPRFEAEFNQQQGGRGDNTINKTFRRPEIGMLVKCDVHSWMNAYVHVMDHPWFGLTGDEGTVKLEGLPAGKYTISVWHEKWKKGEKKVEVEIKAGETANAEVTF